MAISLSSAVAVLGLVQGASDADSLSALWGRVQRDSGDARTWLELGRAYLRAVGDYHAHRAAAAGRDTAWARSALDTAEHALTRAADLGVGTRQADSARLLRVVALGGRALLAWEQQGASGATQVWESAAQDLRLTPVLEELGENLLRACPRQGVLLTATEIDSHAAWFMRFGRGLRPDLVIFPLSAWRRDAVFRRRLTAELGLPRARAGRAPPGLRAVTERRPLCASLGFERAPELEPRVGWNSRPLVWVAGRTEREDRVPPRDFVFAALRLALDENQTWARPVLELYRRAVDETPALCEPLAVYGVREEVGCR